MKVCQRHISWIEIAIVKILTKNNLPEDTEGIFLEINFRKSKWLLYEIYHSTSQNNHCFYDNIDKTLLLLQKIVLAGDFNAQKVESYLIFFIST